MTRGAGRGFASMDPERRRQLAQRGGRRAHELGKAHVFAGEEAKSAGAKGGAALRARFRAMEAEPREQVAPVVAVKAAGTCSKCGVAGPEHKMCRGNS